MTKAKSGEQLSVVSGQGLGIAELAGEALVFGLDELVPASWNARKTFDRAALGELSESIRLHGMLIPLLVRRADDGKHYEIICGHRRYEAVRQLGFATVPCVVRELNDDQAREVAIIDNLQRVDVSPIEEAEAFGELLDRLLSIPAVAAKVGKEQSYVAKSLSLRTLTTWSREALRERLITIDHARLLARLAEAEQNAALKWCIDRQAGVKIPVDAVIKERLERRKVNDDEEDDDTEQAVSRARWRREWECESVQRLKEHIECESGIPLDRAPWPMEEDWLLPDAGSCLDCPKNTKANAPLFGDLDIGVAVCTDGACFKAKVEGFVLHGIQVAQKAACDTARIPNKTPADFQILRVSWKATSTVPRQLKDGGGVNPAQTFKDGQWKEATKKCEHARSAVTVDWSDANNRGYMGREEKLRKPGEIVQACIEPRCKAHPKEYEKAARRDHDEDDPRVNAEAQKKKMEKFNAFVAAERPVRRALYDAIKLKVSPLDMKRVLLSRLRQDFEICYGSGFESGDWDERNAHVAKLIQEATAGGLDDLMFHAVFGREMVIDANHMRSKDRGRGTLRELAKKYSVDAAAIERKFETPLKNKVAEKAMVEAVAKMAKAAPAKKAAKTAPKKAAKKTAAKKAGRK